MSQVLFAQQQVLWPDLKNSPEHTPFDSPCSTRSREYFMLFLYNCVVNKDIIQNEREIVARDTTIAEGLQLPLDIWPSALDRCKLCAFRELAVVLQPGISTQTHCANVLRAMVVIAYGDFPCGCICEFCTRVSAPPGP